MEPTKLEHMDWKNMVDELTRIIKENERISQMNRVLLTKAEEELKKYPEPQLKQADSPAGTG